MFVRSAMVSEASFASCDRPHTTAGIYTIPEISMVGKTEAQLTRAGVSYEVGLADYREVRGGVQQDEEQPSDSAGRKIGTPVVCALCRRWSMHL